MGAKPQAESRPLRGTGLNVQAAESFGRKNLFDDLQKHLLSRSLGRCTQKISHGGDRMPVAADHLADIAFSHLDFEDQLAALLDFCHQHLFRRFDKLPDDKLEKRLHWRLFRCRRRRRSCGGFLARFQDHARDGAAGLSAMRHPIIHSAEVQSKIFTGLARIVVSDHFYKLSVARTAFVRHHHPIIRTVFRSLSS